LAALVDRILGGLRESAEAQPEALGEVTDSSRELRRAETPSVEVAAGESGTTDLAPVSVASQPTVIEASESRESVESEGEPVRRRTHGGALPR
jgi:hypothetical protein